MWVLCRLRFKDATPTATQAERDFLNLVHELLRLMEDETFIGHNRRFVRPDGSVKMLWRNVAKIPTRPVDPWVGVIRIDDHAGKPVAILVNYSCHPVVLGPDNPTWSSANLTDWISAPPSVNARMHIMFVEEGFQMPLLFSWRCGD